MFEEEEERRSRRWWWWCRGGNSSRCVFQGKEEEEEMDFLGLHLSNADFGRYGDGAWRTLIFFATTDFVSAAAGGGVH